MRPANNPRVHEDRLPWKFAQFAGPLVILMLALGFGCSPKVTVLRLDPSSLQLFSKGEQRVLKASPLDANQELVTDALLKIEWSSADPSIAMVHKGAVTALRSGTTRVTAKVGDLSSSLDVVVSIPAMVSVNPKTLGFVGYSKNATVTVEVLDELQKPLVDPKVVWSTTSATVAMIEGRARGQAIVTPHHTGTAEIMASVNKIRASAVVTVRPPTVDKIEISGPATMKEGQSVMLTAVAKALDGSPIPEAQITWKLPNSYFLSLEPNGTIMAKHRGKTKVFARCGDVEAEYEIVIGRR